MVTKLEGGGGKALVAGPLKKILVLSLMRKTCSQLKLFSSDRSYIEFQGNNYNLGGGEK